MARVCIPDNEYGTIRLTCTPSTSGEFDYTNVSRMTDSENIAPRISYQKFTSPSGGGLESGADAHVPIGSGDQLKLGNAIGKIVSSGSVYYDYTFLTPDVENDIGIYNPGKYKIATGKDSHNASTTDNLVISDGTHTLSKDYVESSIICIGTATQCGVPTTCGISMNSVSKITITCNDDVGIV